MIRTGQRSIRLATTTLLGVSALLVAGCNPTETGSDSARPPSRTTPSAQLSATGAPKLTFRPVLGQPAGNASLSRVPVEPSEATTPERELEIAAEKKLRQDPSLLTLDEQGYSQVLNGYRCPATDLLTGHDDPALPLITCDRDNTAKFVLGPAFLDNTKIISSEAELDPQGLNYVVTVKFDDQGSAVWSTFTAANVGKQVALVFNTTALSAPNINEAITGGTAQIAGNFDGPAAKKLADQIAGR